MSYQAVIFDLGGVVLGSPLHAIADYERAQQLPENFVNRVVVDTAPHGAWSRLEKGELSLGDAFFVAFEADCERAGGRIDARKMFASMGEASQPRPEMLDAIARLKQAGLRVAALTNNWKSEEENHFTESLYGNFDVVVESAVEGMRKPDPRIYEIACERLEVEAERAVFLDDIGGNLKPARAMGMATVKVVDPVEAIAELSAIVGVALA